LPRTVQPWVPALRRELRAQSFDLVHAGVFPFTNLIAAAADSCSRRRTPFVCQPMLNTIDPRSRQPDQFYANPHGRRLLARATAVVANTSLEADVLAALGVDAVRITVASPAVNAAELDGGDGDSFRRRHGASGRLLLQISTQTFDKGSLHSVEALRILRAAGRDVRLVLIGAVLPDLASHVARLPSDLRERVLIRGQVPEEEKRDALAACDVLIMPSRTDSFGIAYLEGWWYRKPVIGCFAGGVPEVIDDGVNGFLVPFGEAHMPAEYSAKLLDDRALASAMGERGRAKVESLYTWERTYAIIDALYRRLIP
jgi:glycosyltransferase involved in cell wall biosynthesis